MTRDQPLLALSDISQVFMRRADLAERLVRSLTRQPARTAVYALDGVSLEIAAGEVLGLVGESGCGKSTLARIITGLLRPSRGVRKFRGQDLDRLPAARRRHLQLKLQMIFQDPYASLNPRMRVIDLVGEAPLVHGLIAPHQLAERVTAWLTEVGLDASALQRFPHQFSGGQRARIGIARALALNPDLLVADEAVAALDVSIQAQVLNLFDELRQRLQLTYLFISHDLGVVRHVCDRVAIMYLGRIVELAPTQALFDTPNHPYSQALLAQAPSLKVEKRIFKPLPGDIASPLTPPPGCHFHPRCPLAMARCRTEDPPLKEIAPGRFSACHLNAFRAP